MAKGGRRKARGKAAPELAWLGWAAAGVTLAAFLPALGGAFLNWDDDVNFVGNPDFRGLGPAQIAWAFQTFLLGHYHPLTWLSLEVDYSLWGMNPTGYHLTNALLHAGTAWLAFLLFGDLISAARSEEQASVSTRWGAAVGALFFALHPLRVESVAWVSERRDVLSGLFAVLTVLLYVRGKRGWSLLAFAAALGSKVIAVTVPVWLLVIDGYPLRRGLTVKTTLEKAPYVLLSVGAALVAVGRYDAGVGGAVSDLDLYPALRVMLSAGGLAFYLWKTAAPFGLAPQYVYSADPQPGDGLLVAGAAVALGVTALAGWLAWRGRRALAAAWCVFVVTLAPVLSFVRLDRQQAVNDHHSYLAALAPAVLAGGLWALWHERVGRRALVAAACVLTLLAGLTVRQIGYWSDSLTLWSYAAEAQPLSIIAHNNLGRALADEGRSDEAAASFRRALAIVPRFSQANYNLGLLLARDGKQAEAQAAFEKALERSPGNARILTDLGNALLRQQLVEAAIERYEEAVAADPALADARFNLGLALELAGRRGEAREQFEAVTELEPENQDAWRRLRQ